MDQHRADQERFEKHEPKHCDLYPWVWETLCRRRAAIDSARFPPGTEVLVAKGKAAIAAAGRQHQSRTRVTGTDHLCKDEIVEDRSSTTGGVYKGFSGSGTFTSGGKAAATTSTVLGTAQLVS